MHIRRSHATIALIVFAVAALILIPNSITVIISFIFIGIIPGTSITIPSWISLLGCVALLILAVRWLLDSPSYRPVATNKDLARRRAARRHVMRATATRSTTRRHAKQTVRA